MPRFFRVQLGGSIVTGIITIVSLILDVRSASISLVGHEIQWQWWALGGFIMFAVFMIWMVIGLWQDPAHIEVRKDYLKQHLEAVKCLIEQWRSDINTPIVSQIDLKYSEILLSSECNPLFNSLRKHLPNQNIWKNYESWKAPIKKYVDLCKSFRTEIRQSWTIDEVKVNWNFEQPIMRLLAGQDKKLRYRLWVASGHDLSELKYQVLNVNDMDVFENPIAATFPPPLLDEQCSGETLPLEYQKIADHFLSSDAAKELMGLYKKGLELETTMRNSLQNMLLASEHSKHTCEYCQRLV
jgi:hypothetical protein